MGDGGRAGIGLEKRRVHGGIQRRAGRRAQPGLGGVAHLHPADRLARLPAGRRLEGHCYRPVASAGPESHRGAQAAEGLAAASQQPCRGRPAAGPQLAGSRDTARGDTGQEARRHQGPCLHTIGEWRKPIVPRTPSSPEPDSPEDTGSSEGDDWPTGIAPRTVLIAPLRPPTFSHHQRNMAHRVTVWTVKTMFCSHSPVLVHITSACG